MKPTYKTSPDRFAMLLQKWLLQTLSDIELDEFLQASGQPWAQEILGDSIVKDLQEGKYIGLDDEATANKIFTNIIELKSRSADNKESRKAIVVNIFRNSYVKWASMTAAAFFIVFLLYKIPQKKGGSNTIAAIANHKTTTGVAPQQTLATITLADGKKIYTDSLQIGVVVYSGASKITKSESGEIVYEVAASNQDADQINTINNPIGSKPIKLLLSDGSSVWLSTASTISFPVKFGANERKVEMKGEAYFEVAKNKTKRFLVNASGVITEVLGTHFNVRSYEGEENTKITLLEGSVKVSPIGSAITKMLKPNQQAEMDADIKILNDVNVAEVMAWKNGKFIFNDTKLSAVLIELSRWYNVQIKYADKIPDSHFRGTISRAEDLSTVLELLEKTGSVHFTMQGSQVIVMP